MEIDDRWKENNNVVVTRAKNSSVQLESLRCSPHKIITTFYIECSDHPK